MKSAQNYTKILLQEFQSRTRRNAAYSLRSFARDLNLSHSSLSRILGGSQGLSEAKAEEVIRQLKLTGHEADRFRIEVQSQHSRSKRTRESAQARLTKNEFRISDLSLEHFKIVSDWYHYAILELSTLQDFQSDVTWISQRLNISELETKAAIKRLISLELLEKSQDGTIKKTTDFQATPSGTPSRALKNHHQQMLKKAEAALFDQDLDERDFSSITFAMSSETLSWAKQEMKSFRRSLTRKLATEKKKDRLYVLSMQLFALDQIQFERPLKGKI